MIKCKWLKFDSGMTGKLIMTLTIQLLSLSSQLEDWPIVPKACTSDRGKKMRIIAWINESQVKHMKLYVIFAIKIKLSVSLLINIAGPITYKPHFLDLLKIRLGWVIEVHPPSSLRNVDLWASLVHPAHWQRHLI